MRVLARQHGGAESLSEIVCVSHLAGADGEAMARRVSERLAFRYLDEEIIEKAAEGVDLHPSVVGDVERRKSLMARIGEAMTGQSSPRLLQGSDPSSGGREMPSSEDLRAVIRDAIRETAQTGGIVIASHAASMVLADRDDAFRREADCPVSSSQARPIPHLEEARPQGTPRVRARGLREPFWP
jgi:hypothetical protein